MSYGPENSFTKNQLTFRNALDTKSYVSKCLTQSKVKQSAEKNEYIKVYKEKSHVNN